MNRLGLDIGGTKINIGIVNDGACGTQLIANRKLAVKDVTDAVSDIKRVVLELCAEGDIEYSSIASCGVGVPGTVSNDGRRLLKAPNISILSENFCEELQNSLSMPTFMVQDSRAAALGEYRSGNGVGAKTLICFTLGTGIGTGIVIDGKIYNGALGAAGELGHIPAVQNGRECGCGKNGCVEKYCAGRGLDITSEDLFGRGKSAADLFSEATNGNKAADEAIKNAVVMLGNAIVSAVNLLSPDRVLFSGGLSEQTELFLKPLVKYISDNCYSSGELPIIEKAKLGENSPLVGAALFPTTLCDFKE